MHLLFSTRYIYFRVWKWLAGKAVTADTVIFVISRWPVQSRRVAPHLLSSPIIAPDRSGQGIHDPRNSARASCHGRMGGSSVFSRIARGGRFALRGKRVDGTGSNVVLFPVMR